MNRFEIVNELFEAQDEGYKQFHSALVPGIDNIIGVRLPVIRSIAKRYAGTEIGNSFITVLPHTYYEEYMAHALMIGFLKSDREEIEAHISAFIPYIDNWAVCDSFVSCLKRYFKDREAAWTFLQRQLKIGGDYRIRFVLVSLLNYYIDDTYADRALEIAVSVSSESYYVRMAQAWLVSVAAVKQYDKAVYVLENRLLCPWTHNKAIQKSKESYRLSKERKEYLNTLKVKGEQ